MALIFFMVNAWVSVLIRYKVRLCFDLGLGENNIAVISKLSLKVRGRLGVKLRMYLLLVLILELVLHLSLYLG